MINPQKPVINPIKNCNRFTALIVIPMHCPYKRLALHKSVGELLGSDMSKATLRWGGNFSFLQEHDRLEPFFVILYFAACSPPGSSTTLYNFTIPCEVEIDAVELQ